MEAHGLRIVFTGTGTSQGVPVIGCECAVCRSADPRDQRLRTAIVVQYKNTTVAIDTGPDFRQQMLRAGVRELQAVLLTHEHNDHIIGLDDVRPFNFRQKRHMPVYGLPRVLSDVRRRFAYIFDYDPYPGAPRVDLLPLEPYQPLRIGEMEILPFIAGHGNMDVLGFRFGPFTYITDMKTIPEESLEAVRGTEILVVNALHHNPHFSHLNLEEALDFIEKVKPRQAYLTHISHHMGRCADINPGLPEGVEMGYDGLAVEVKW
jgi:phosphoribosyl 1,2-cyclic phosphate phosphodiesterase